MTIEKHLSKLKALNRSPRTIENVEYVLRKLEKYKPIEQITQDDLIAYFESFKGSPYSKKMNQAVIKTFFKDSGRSDLVGWIKPIRVNDEIDPEQVLTSEDVNRMLEAAESPYWKAWIAFAFESGARFGEIQALKWKDFKESSDGLVVEIKTTKTRARDRLLLLPLSSGYIRNLKLYTKASPEDRVFPFQEPYTLTIVKRIGEKAGIEKRISLHGFRHSQATDMVHRGYNESIIRQKLGWQGDSRMIARYVHPDREAIINATRGKHGINEGAKPIQHIDIKPVESVNLVEAAAQLSKLSEENETLRKGYEELKRKMELITDGIQAKQNKSKDKSRQRDLLELKNKNIENLPQKRI